MTVDDSKTFAALVADVYELAGSLRRHGEVMARTFGQTQARWQVMSVVSDGEWTAPDIARRLGVTRQAIQRVVDDLADDGQVQLIANPAHRRSSLVTLTKVGRRTLAAITAVAETWHQDVTAELPADRLDRLHRDVRVLLDHVTALEAGS
jgi:DNA-binding MarR family transcriptional regulator